MTIQYTDLIETVEFEDLPRTGLRRPGVYRNIGKRVLDVSLVLVSLPVVLPLILIAAFLISLDGSSPFYRQKRLGRNGSIFDLWKLRTMMPNAEAALVLHLARNPEARAEWDRTQKLKDDPRITRIGRILRKTSLDELPQLFNVLRGEMSLIGPRPMMCDQRSLYPGTAYYRMLPGLSGFWQISERNETEFRSRAMFDLQYERAMSLRTDLMVIVRTFGVMLRCTGH